MARLTQGAINAAVAKGEKTDLKDGAVPGLSLRIGKRKSSWRLYYRLKGFKSLRVVTLGELDQVPLAKARELATAARADISNGIDPHIEKMTRLDDNINAGLSETVRECWIRFMSEREHNWTEATKRGYVSDAVMFNRLIGDIPIAIVKRGHLLQLIKDVIEESSGDGTPA